jgi:pyruvate dehydrogenase E1 component alpha subunit
MLTAKNLIDFETEVAAKFAAAEIHSPVHFSGGNESALIDLFKTIKREDWVFSNWRSHYHCLLHGVPRARVMADILDGKSMNLNYPEYRVLSSAIVGGTLPIACGVAARGHRCWVFVGDMAATTGMFHEAQQYADGHDLPITFVIEDNGLSTNTPTRETWGTAHGCSTVLRYQYQRVYPHVGLTQRVEF